MIYGIKRLVLALLDCAILLDSGQVPINQV